MYYVLLAEHSAETCPTSNSKVREVLQKSATEMPNIAKKLGVEIIGGPYANREHILVAVVRSEKAEAVDRFISESNLSQWNKVKVLPSHTLDEPDSQRDLEIAPIF